MDAFKLIGKKLPSQTRNLNGKSGRDCSKLWQEFEEEQIVASVTNKLSDVLYAVYYDYESDENGWFSYFIGFQVAMNEITPEGLDELLIPAQNYHIETAKGQMTGCISDAWQRIWQGDIHRAFGYDFEIYDERSHDWENVEVDIYLSIR